MDNIAYFNDLLARTEELFYHELSDCAAWKTEYIGIDFIQAKNIEGSSPGEVIENSIKAITAAGFIKGASYAIRGNDILLNMKIKKCIHLPKEAKLMEGGIKPYNCPIINMVLDQLIEKVGFATTYVADLQVDQEGSECTIKSAIYSTPDKIGDVSDWNEECRLIDENNEWIHVE